MTAAEVDLIVGCLERYREHDAAPSLSGSLPITSPAEIVWPIPVGDQLASLLADPIRSALRGRVRDIGWRIFTRDGLSGMHAAMGEVEQAMPDCPSWAGSTLDHWWNGIGSKAGGVWEA